MTVRSKLFISGLLGLTLCSVSFAGVGSSGGGKGVLCNGHFLRTLDLYEAEEIYNLTISNRYSDLESNLSEYGTRLVAYLNNEPTDISDPTTRAEALAETKKEVISLFRDIPLNSSLPVTDDATLPPLPSNCSVVQIAIYSDLTNTIQRDFNLWNMLSLQDQTALILHEALYKAARETKAKTSDDTRRIVGMILAEAPLPAINQPIFGKKKLSCLTFAETQPDLVLGSAFYVIDSSKGGKSGVSFYLSVLDGYFNMARTTVFIPGTSIQTLATVGMPSMQLIANQDIFNRFWHLEIIPSSNPQSFGLRAWLEGSTPSGMTVGFCQLQ
jgi:hypothetical protein